MNIPRRQQRTIDLAVLAAVIAALITGQLSLAAPGLNEISLVTEKPLLRVGAFQRGPVIDGKLDDPAWAGAQLAGPFWHFQTGAPSKHDTWAKLGIDRDYLYAGFHCAEAEMARLKPAPLPLDSMALYANDHIELFLMPDALGGAFYHFSVDVAGNRHDERGSDGAWGCDWQAAVDLGVDGWTVELRIPREAVSLRNPGMSLANFCRTRRLEPAETSAWSKTFGIFHNPARFGRVVYGSTGGIDLASVTLRQPEPGTHLVDVVLGGAAESTGVVVEGYVGEGETLSRFASRSVHVSGPAGAQISLPLQVERDTRARLLIAVREADHVTAFVDSAEVGLSGTKATPIRQVLGPHAAPFMRWIDSERLRGISYGLDFARAMPDDGLVRTEADATPPIAEPVRLRGESYFLIDAAAGEPIQFDLAAVEDESAFKDAIYALFSPDGAMLAKGIVEAGTTAQVNIPTGKQGRYTLLVNSGPASWNPFAIFMRNSHWALDARGKSIYIHTPVSLHSLRDCRLAGMNIALMAAWLWGIPFKDDEGLAKWSDKLETLCRASQDAGIKLIPYVGWGCASTEPAAAGEYTRALTRLSVRGPQPCPISRAYWERTFLRRALAIARLSKRYPAVIGVGLDPESYYFADWYAKNLKSPEEQRLAWSITQPSGGSDEKCACNDCFGGYLNARGIAPPDLPEDGNARFDWIADKGLLDDYCAYQQGELEKILGDIRQQVHAVNPDLCFAVLLLTIGDNWFCRGMARGLGTPEVPALDFDEGTYTSGYSASGLQAKLDLYDRWDAHVVHGGCLWAMKHPPGDPHFLAAQMYNFALYGNGYWFWPGSMSVWRDADKVAGYYSLSGYTEDYWRSIAQANREIDERLAAPETYRSELEQIRQRPAIPVEPKAGERNEWAKKPWYPVHIHPGTRLSFTVPPGRKSIEVRWGYRESLGERTLLVSVAGQERRLTASVQAERANAAEIEVPQAGCTGWVELLESPEPDGACIGLSIAGAKPFFGGATGMALR